MGLPQRGAGPAAAHPESCATWKPFLQPGGICHATLACGSDCVAGVRADLAVPRGCLALDAALQHSLHAAPGEALDYRCAAFRLSWASNSGPRSRLAGHAVCTVHHLLIRMS